MTRRESRTADASALAGDDGPADPQAARWALEPYSGKLTASPGLATRLGVAPTALPTTLDALLALVHPDDRQRLRDAVAATLAATGNLDIEHRVQATDPATPEDALTWVHQVGRLVRTRIGGTRLVVAVNDATERVQARERLRQSQALLRIAGRAARIGGWAIDLPQRRMRWSDEMCELLDYPLGTVPDIEARLALYAPDARAIISDALEKCILDGTPIDCEVELRTGSGRLIDGRVIGEALRDDGGRIVRIEGALQDISERKRADASLRESEQRFRSIAKATADAIWDWDLHDHSVWWNEGLHGLFGYRADEFGSDADAWVEHIHPDDRDRVVNGIHAVHHGGQEHWSDSYRFRHRNGSYLYVMDRGVVVRDAAGAARRMVGGMTDLSERRNDEERVRTSEERLRATLDGALDCIVSMDAEGNVVEFNPAAERIFGHRREDVLGRNLAELLIPPELRSAHSQGVKRYLRDGVRHVLGQRLELPALRADGSTITVELTTAALGGGHGDLFTAFMRDITERKRNERMEAGQRDVLAGIAARRPLLESLDTLARLYESQHPGAQCSILLLDDAGERVRHGAAPSLPEAYSQAIHDQPIGEGAGSCGTAAHRRKPVLVADIANDPLWRDYAPLALSYGLRACWSVPVLSSPGKVLATFGVYYGDVRHPRPQELATIQDMVALTQIAIEQAVAFRDLERGEQRFRSLFDEHPDAVYAMDLHGRITAANGRVHALIESLPAATVSRLLDARLNDARPNTDSSAVDSDPFGRHHDAHGVARSYDTHAVNSDGRRMDARVTTLPIMVEGRIEGMFGIAHDITVLRNHERALAASLNRSEQKSRKLRRLNQAAITVNQQIGNGDIRHELAALLRSTLDARLALVCIGVAGGAPIDPAVSSASGVDVWHRAVAAPGPASGLDALIALVRDRNQALRLDQTQLRGHPLWQGLHALAQPLRGLLAVPLPGRNGRNIGTLVLSDRQHGDFDEDDELIALQFAQMAAAAIERSELLERLHECDRFFELSLELACIVDTASGRFMQANPAFSRLLGFSLEELKSRPFLDFIHPDDRDATGEVTDALARAETRSFGFSNRYVCRDGSVVWVEWSLVIVPGETIYGVGRNITDRRAAEDVAQRFGRLLHSSFNEIYLFDAHTLRFIDVSDGAKDNLGYSSEEITALTPVDIKPAYSAEAFERMLAPLRAGEQDALTFETFHRRKDGSTYPVEVRLQLVQADRPNFLAVIQDITERRRAQVQLQRNLDALASRNRELQDFAFVASHDLQEPLRKIRAFSDRLLARHGGGLDEAARDYLLRSVQAAQRMQTLIDDLLAYTRIAAAERRFVPVELATLIGAVVEDLAARVESSGGRVEVDTLPTLDGDPTQLRQLFQNLIANALKFRAPDRPPHVRISAEAVTAIEPGNAGHDPLPRAADSHSLEPCDGSTDNERWPAPSRGKAWRIVVRDNGIGLDPQYAERIFKPFQRLHGRHEYEGTGIGLAIVRRIAERHHGHVTVESVLGQGAAFMLTLPARQRSARDDAADAAPVAAPPATFDSSMRRQVPE